jgi:hypothetical protein
VSRAKVRVGYLLTGNTGRRRRLYIDEVPKARLGASPRPQELNRPSGECLTLSECISISVAHTFLV